MGLVGRQTELHLEESVPCAHTEVLGHAPIWIRLAGRYKVVTEFGDDWLPHTNACARVIRMPAMCSCSCKKRRVPQDTCDTGSNHATRSWYQRFSMPSPSHSRLPLNHYSMCCPGETTRARWLSKSALRVGVSDYTMFCLGKHLIHLA